MFRSLVILFATLSVLALRPQAAHAGCDDGDCDDGVGTKSFADGTEYVGEFVDGKRTGKGRYRWPDGSTYEGEVADGALTVARTEVNKTTILRFVRGCFVPKEV